GALRDGGLTVGRLVLVNDALGRRLAELASRVASQGLRLVDVTGGGCFMEPPDGGLHLGLDRLVAQAGLLVGENALFLGLDVRHERVPSVWLDRSRGRVNTRPPRLPVLRFTSQFGGQVDHVAHLPSPPLVDRRPRGHHDPSPPSGSGTSYGWMM